MIMSSLTLMAVMQSLTEVGIIKERWVGTLQDFPPQDFSSFMHAIRLHYTTSGRKIEEQYLLSAQVRRPPAGQARVRLHRRFALPLIHFAPDSLTDSVPLFLK
jgi:hypothetical protein